MLALRFQHKNKTIGYLGKFGGLTSHSHPSLLMDVSDRTQIEYSVVCVQDLKDIGMIPKDVLVLKEEF